MDRDELILNNIRLVHSCCNHFKNRGIEYEDLYSAGCIGLVKAADNFDPQKGFKFSTYAFPVIMGEIKRLFRDGGTLKVSRNVKELAVKIRSSSERLTQMLGRSPKISELANYLKVTNNDVIQALEASAPVASLSYYNDNGELKEQDLGFAESAEDAAANKLTVDLLLEKLDKSDRELIVLRYLNHKTQEETAKTLGTTQVAVSRLEKKILKRLREYAK